MIAVLKPGTLARAAVRPTLVLAGLACIALAAGCGGGYGRDFNGLAVVAGPYPIAWAADEVGGPAYNVLDLTPSGAEPHDLELTARDVTLVQAADIVFLLRGFQPELDEAATGADHARTVDLLENASPLAGVGGAVDPHVWLDPVRFEEVVVRIGDELVAPAAAARLAGRLRALDREYRRGLVECERRELVTSHAAFGYLAARYGLEQIPIAGLAPEPAPAARELADVIARVRRTGATTVFVEPLGSPRPARAVARATGAATAVLDPIEGLTPEGAARGEDYFTLMRANLAALRAALDCR
jgi:zinc transport system substrate-binding protein